MDDVNSSRKRSLMRLIGPGILVAATGVGAGDLATGAFTGAQLGVAVLWAVTVGALLKYVLNEGLARWQLATGQTVLEGVAVHFGRITIGAFLVYLFFWSFFVGSALMSACGVTLHAIFPLLEPNEDKIFYGILHSAAAVIAVRRGGYELFQKIMGICIGVMFVTVIVTAIASRPSWSDVLSGLVWPTIPNIDGGGLAWTVALMGGVGGTVTVLCYGYWILEEGRDNPQALGTCRADLAIGYAMTALFGIGMVILGSTVSLEKESPAQLIVTLADQLEQSLGDFGPFGRWAFLVGAWGAVASSMMGVWQCVPCLFADSWSLLWKQPGQSAPARRNTDSRPYRVYLYLLAFVPIVGLPFRFDTVQKLYAIVGAAFMPALAVALLMLNGRWGAIPQEYRNSRLTTLLLFLTLALFLLAGWYELQKQWLADS